LDQMEGLRSTAHPRIGLRLGQRDVVAGDLARGVARPDDLGAQLFAAHSRGPLDSRALLNGDLLAQPPIADNVGAEADGSR
jgi:hypothetical protein